MWCIIGNLQEVVTVHVQRGTGLLSLNFGDGESRKHFKQNF